MKIGIICAMEEEIRLIKEDIILQKTEIIANREFYIGTLYGKEVVLVMSRIGKVAAALTATILAQNFAVDLVVFSGVAGGVGADMKVGDAVVADYTIQHDFTIPGREIGTVPMININYFEAEEKYRLLALDAVNEYIDTQMLSDIPKQYLDEFKITAPKAVIATVASGDEFICTNEKNIWLDENINNCKCAEMEGAAVAQVCYEFGIPYTVIRIISDCADDEASVDFDAFALNAASHFTKGSLKAFVIKL